ncbi:uncharacterized protein LOC133329847, partial [Musca vetustissima]|uniref:uncharacterized protein LOC133329847 n=1 Tax=Musca vetustissima TaxID=27455 RepID=UPI002AB62800
MLREIQKCLNIIILLNIPLVVVIGAKPNSHIQFTQCTCQYNTTRIRHLDCSVKNDSNHVGLIYGRLELASVIADFSIRSTIHSYRKNLAPRKLLELTVNACDILDVAQKTKLIVTYVNNFKKYLNVVPKCPFRK